MFVHGMGHENDNNGAIIIDDFYDYRNSDAWTSEDDDTTTTTNENGSDSLNGVRSSSSSSSSSTVDGKKRMTPSSTLLPLHWDSTMDTQDVAAGTFRILQIPTLSLKPGGLRLFLVMYVLGAIPPLMIRKNPTASHSSSQSQILIWKVDRPSTEEYIIDLYYHDHSAMLSIELIPAVVTSKVDVDDNSEVDTDTTRTPTASSIDESTTSNEHSGAGPSDKDNNQNSNRSSQNETNGMIYIHRIGSSPSTMYRMHEATLLQGLLQELLTCATDPIILHTNDRLLTLTNTTQQQMVSIGRALPFG